MHLHGRGPALITIAELAVATLTLLALEGNTQLTSGVRNVTIEDGSVAQVEAGELQVPESRRWPSDRRITIPYYRLRADSPKPASPIFLLPIGDISRVWK